MGPVVAALTSASAVSFFSSVTFHLLTFLTVAVLAPLLGLDWFEGGFMFGGAHAFFRVLAGCLWAIAGYTARKVKS